MHYWRWHSLLFIGVRGDPRLDLLLLRRHLSHFLVQRAAPLPQPAGLLGEVDHLPPDCLCGRHGTRNSQFRASSNPGPPPALFTKPCDGAGAGLLVHALILPTCSLAMYRGSCCSVLRISSSSPCCWLCVSTAPSSWTCAKMEPQVGAASAQLGLANVVYHVSWCSALVMMKRDIPDRERAPAPPRDCPGLS